jgi:hypothetical protein
VTSAQPAPALVRSATQLTTAECRFCQLYRPYHYSANPLSTTITETQTPRQQHIAETQIPRHQPITETQPPTTSLTSRLALSNSLFYINIITTIDPSPRRGLGSIAHMSYAGSLSLMFGCWCWHSSHCVHLLYI